MDRNTPDWFENNAVNEVRFCEDFLKEKPLKCVNNVFYSVDGALPNDVVSGGYLQQIKRLCDKRDCPKNR